MDTHAQTLRQGFDRAARHYDTMVGLNPGYHRHLNKAAQRLIDKLGEGASVLDVGCGSGASTRALYRRGAGTVFGVDASPGMIEQARAKSWPRPTEFVVSLAQELQDHPHPRLREPFDGVFAAYLIRNVPAPQRDEVLRCLVERLRPGGSIVLVEYGLGKARWPRWVWNLVCWMTVIPMAAVLVRDTSLFRYLWKSVHEADAPQRLSARLWTAGCTQVEHHAVNGWQRGILHVWVARRPES